jgi:hypothetical protein
VSASTSFRVFGPSMPSYAELAAESWWLALRLRVGDDTLGDRLAYIVRAHRLSNAAQWERLGEVHFLTYYRHYVLPRLAPALGASLLAIYLLDPSRPAGPQIWVIVQLLLVAVAMASLWALLYWPQPRRDMVFAARYRATRVERDRQLLSPDGWNGWRAERRGDGRYVIVPVEPRRAPALTPDSASAPAPTST